MRDGGTESGTHLRRVPRRQDAVVSVAMDTRGRYEVNEPLDELKRTEQELGFGQVAKRKDGKLFGDAVTSRAFTHLLTQSRPPHQSAQAGIRWSGKPRLQLRSHGQPYRQH